MSNYPYVPYGTTVHGEDEINAVVNVLKTSTQMGKNVRELEEKVAGLYNKKYGIGVNSDSSALYLAADLLNYDEGTEIITPALTFSTTVAPLVKRKWIPAFVDVEEGMIIYSKFSMLPLLLLRKQYNFYTPPSVPSPHEVFR